MLSTYPTVVQPALNATIEFLMKNEIMDSGQQWGKINKLKGRNWLQQNGFKIGIGPEITIRSVVEESALGERHFALYKRNHERCAGLADCTALAVGGPRIHCTLSQQQPLVVQRLPTMKCQVTWQVHTTLVKSCRHIRQIWIIIQGSTFIDKN